MTSTAGPLVAGIELGGTKCVCTLAAGPDRIVAEARIPTTTPEETLGGIERILDAWRDAPGFAALGVACFGPLELRIDAPDYGFITATPKPGWAHSEISPRLRRRYGLPTAIDTDVTGAALAEARWGDAQGLSSFAYITVGTGVGAGIVVDGKAVMGIGHAEAGHMLVRRFPGDDWAGACPFHGDCVEGLAAGPAVEKRLGIKGGDVADDDPVWDTVAHAIAGLCHNLVLGSVPERILLGGGLPTKRPQLLPMVRRMLVESLAGYGVASLVAERIDRYVTAPGLGDQAGPLGSIALGLDALGRGEAGG
jgi:fructokinase